MNDTRHLHCFALKKYDVAKIAYASLKKIQPCPDCVRSCPKKGRRWIVTQWITGRARSHGRECATCQWTGTSGKVLSFVAPLPGLGRWKLRKGLERGGESHPSSCMSWPAASWIVTVVAGATPVTTKNDEDKTEK